MKTQSNQSLSTIDIIHVILAVIFLIAIISPILQANHAAKNRELIQSEAKKIAGELLTKLQDASKIGKEQKRSFASIVARSENADFLEGVSGTDPWGQSYRYKILRDAFGKPTHIVVWSIGPDAKIDTPDENLNSLNLNAMQFQGDDIGYLQSIEL